MLSKVSPGGSRHKSLESTPKPRTYQIRGIPSEVLKDELLAQLRESHSGEEISHFTLAPGAQKKLVATLTCQYPLDVSKTGYAVDTDLFGVTPLASPIDASVE